MDPCYEIFYSSTELSVPILRTLGSDVRQRDFQFGENIPHIWLKEKDVTDVVYTSCIKR